MFEEDFVFPHQVDAAADFDDEHEDAGNDVEGAVPAAPMHGHKTKQGGRGGVGRVDKSQLQMATPARGIMN